MLEKLYEDSEIKINYHKVKDSKVILIVFNPLEWGASDGDIWGYSVLSRSGYSILGITSKLKNWFPDASVYGSLPSISPILRGYSNRLTYGYSMGGYAALRYSKALGASHVLAFSPQSTIDPKDLGKEDRRYTQYFSEVKNKGMKILSSEISGEVYIIYDKCFSLDRNHVVMLGFENFNGVNLSRTGHGSIRVLAKSRSILEIIELTLNNKNSIEIRNKLVRYRRFIPEYYESMMILAAKRSRWSLIDSLFLRAKDNDLASLSVKRKYAELLSNQRRYKDAVTALYGLENNNVLNQVGTYFILDKQYPEAISVLSKLVENSKNIHFCRNLAKAYELSGDTSSALSSLASFESDNLNNPDFLCHFGRLLAVNKQTNRGRELCQLAVTLRPAEPYFTRILESIG